MIQAKLYLRADGNSKMGLGHVIRTLSLAEMVKEYFDCHFLIRDPLPELKAAIQNHCDGLIRLKNSENYHEEAKVLTRDVLLPGDIIVLDGYEFDTTYQQILRDRDCRIICIDDIMKSRFVADVVINHAGGIQPEQYTCESYTELFLGPLYALIRKPFRDAALNRKDHLTINQEILICMGGSDPNNDLLEVLDKCGRHFENATLHIVLGAGYTYNDQLSEYLETFHLPFQLYSDLSAIELCKLMKKCSLAITPPSTISYEYMSIGGLLFIKQTADNQQFVYHHLTTNKLAFCLNDDLSNHTNFEKLLDQCQINQSLIFDGKQDRRITRIVQFYTLSTRRATSRDCHLYFQWVNDDETRKQSFHSDVISLTEHEEWFQSKLASATSVLYVIERMSEPIGQVRFDIDDATANISYSLDRKFRSKGLGQLLLKRGINSFRNEYPEITDITGFVKANNIASRKAFQNLNFHEDETTTYENTFKYTMS